MAVIKPRELLGPRRGARQGVHWAISSQAAPK